MSSSLLFVHILHLSSSLSHSLSCFFCCCFFSYPPPLCPNCYLTFKASFLFTSFLFTLLNNWNSSLLQNHTRNPESFLTQTLRRIRLSNSRKRKHCGWRGGVCQVVSRGSLIVPRQRLDCWYIRSPSLLSSCHRTAMKAYAPHGRFSRWINERISTIFVQLFFSVCLVCLSCTDGHNIYIQINPPKKEQCCECLQYSWCDSVCCTFECFSAVCFPCSYLLIP